jgi:hypothetical protein
MVTDLTDQDIAEMKAMYSAGKGLTEILKKFGTGYERTMKIVDPEQFDNYMKGKRDRRRMKWHRQKEFINQLKQNNPIYDPLRDGVTSHQSLTALVMGDPLPGRSALERKNAEKQKARV